MFDDLKTQSDESLPIVVNTSGMFDPNDEKSQYLLEKLQGWINFQALASNWYVDENNVVSIRITLMPEGPFLKTPEHNSDLWASLSGAGFSGLVKANQSNKLHEVIVAISNDDLKEMMEDGKSVEPTLQSLLIAVCNYLTVDNNLTRLR